MNIATIEVSGTYARIGRYVTIPAGIVGATVDFRFTDDLWAGLQKTVVFRSSVTRDVLLTGTVAVIPHETVAKPGDTLYVGVYGVDADNNLVIPTLWTGIGGVRDAADPSGDPGTDPTLPVWAQLQKEIDEIKQQGPGPEGGGNVDLTGYATEQWVQDQKYLTAVPDGYAKTDGVDPKGTATSAVSQHNTADDSHNDIRLELKAISDRLTAFFDSDDQTLDELSEIVAYITSNKTLIDSITTSKVSVADIINNLTTNVTNKPLSAAQGVVLKGLIDTLSGNLANYQPKGDYALRSEIPAVPTKVSAFTNDAGYLTQHQDLSGYAKSSDIPKKVSELENDKGYLTEHQDISGKADQKDVDSLASNQSALSARMDTFTALGEGSTTGDAELMDARVDCEGKVWNNAGGHIRGITEKIIDACCDKEIIGAHNYNLFKISEVSFKSRLDNTSSDIVSSSDNNFVTGWFPVTYGKYYSNSIYRSDLGKRSHNGITVARVQLKLADGTIKVYTNADGGNAYPVTINADNSRVWGVDDENAVYMRIHSSMYIGGAINVNTADKMKAYEPMIVEGTTADEAISKALNLEYLDGDIEMTPEVKYTLKRQTANEFDPTGYRLPILYLTGDISPIKVSKDNEVTLDYVYGNRSGTCTLKGQGASSYTEAKKLVEAGKAGKFNYTIKFDNAFEAVSGWGSQKKYCLKANFIDHTHSRNVVSCKLWGSIVKSRVNVPTELANLPNGGAIDGFPVIIMLNKEFHGLYTFNIPKDGWMFGLVEDTANTQAVVSAQDHKPATQFKGELAGDESDFELEFVSDESNADWVTTSLNRLINACINSNGTDLDTTLAQYIDWNSAIDYYIHAVVEKGSDTVDKNFLLVTFDGTKWYFTNYDRDSTYGLAWNASGLTIADANVVDFEMCATISRMFELIRRYKTAELKNRYAKLRENILSESRICRAFETFAWDISTPILLEDVKKYPTIRGSSVNTTDQICRWIHQRLEACDAWIKEL